MDSRMYRFWGRTPPPENRVPIRAEVPSPQTDDGVAVMRLYEPIDSWGDVWGVSAKEFIAALDETGDAKEIRLHINSPGGEVYEGIAIVNALRNHPAKVVAVVDGIAASAAAFLATAADELIMGRNTELMIHDAWGLCVGNAEDMRRLGEDLDRLSDNIASIYAEKAGGTVKDWRAAMLAETWYTADEAVEAGLANRVDVKAEPAKNAFDLSMFNHAGRADAPPPPIPQPYLTVNEIRTAEGLESDVPPDEPAVDSADTAAPAAVSAEPAADEPDRELLLAQIEQRKQFAF